MSERLSMTDVRRRLGDLLDRVRLRHERIIVERKGTPIAAIVPMETLDRMEALSRRFMVETLSRRRPGRFTDRRADALANEAKHRSRRRK